LKIGIDMVCEKCQTKLSQLCVPDKWKDGASNTVSGGGIRAGKSNKMLQKMKPNSLWIPQNNSCKICKSKVLANMNYCNDCAHVKGICSMCGKKSVNTSAHRMSLV